MRRTVGRGDRTNARKEGKFAGGKCDGSPEERVESRDADERHQPSLQGLADPFHRVGEILRALTPPGFMFEESPGKIYKWGRNGRHEAQSQLIMERLVERTHR